MKRDDEQPDPDMARAQAETIEARGTEHFADMDADVFPEVCVCGHGPLGHHRKCNGHVGKFWCPCKEYRPAGKSSGDVA